MMMMMMNKRRGQVSEEGYMVPEFWLITLDRPDLVLDLAKVGYLCRSGHEAHSLWDVFLSARGNTREKRSAHASLPCFRRIFAIEIIRDNKTN